MNLAEFPEDWSSALVVVAHPDDVEYIGAAAIARWTAMGKRVSYLFASRGEAGLDGVSPDECGALRVKEQVAAAAEVGVSVVEFLDHPDGMIKYGLRLRRDIARAIRRLRPELVVVGNPWDFNGNGALNMADHRVVGLAAIDAVRDAANRWVFRELSEPAWSGVHQVAVIGSPNPTHAVDVGDWMAAGVRALLTHQVYLDSVGTTPREAEAMLRGFAQAVARRFHGRPGVAFQVLP